MVNSGWNGDLANIPDVSEIAVRKAADRGELNDWPLMLRVILRTVAILTGSTNAQVRTAVRQAHNDIRGA